MPIPGLMENIQLPNIGDIRKGSAKTESGQMGRDLDYFRFVPSVDFTQPGSVEKSNFLEERWLEAFGDKPKSFSAFFPFAQVERNLDAWNLAFSAAGMKRKCDGNCVVREMVGATYVNYKPGEKPCVCASDPNMKAADRCKPTARIFLLIPQLRVAGMVVLHTTSKLDIINLYSQMMAAEALLGGRVNSVPFLFKRSMRKISTPRGDQRIQTPKSLLSVHIDPVVTERRMEQFLLNGTLALPVGKPQVAENRLLVDGQRGTEYDGEQAIEVSAQDAEEAEQDEETERLLADLREQILEEAAKNWDPKRVTGGLRLWIDRMTKSRTSLLDELNGEELATLLGALKTSVAKKAVKPVATETAPTVAPASAEGDAEEDGNGDPGDDEDAVGDHEDEGAYREIEGATI